MRCVLLAFAILAAGCAPAARSTRPAPDPLTCGPSRPGLEGTPFSLAAAPTTLSLLEINPVSSEPGDAPFGYAVLRKPPTCSRR